MSPRATDFPMITTAQDIYTRLNPEGKGCIKLIDLDILTQGFQDTQRQALKRFFN